MPVNTQPLIELTLTLDTVDFKCQVIEAEHIPPAYAAGQTVTETACPDGRVVEDTGSLAPGSLKGTVYADTSESGITWALRQAIQANAEMVYKIVHYPELGAAGAMQETGKCKVATFSYGNFKKPGLGKHPIDLALLDTSGAGATRPVARRRAASAATETVPEPMPSPS